ncbi:MAG: hypothetical protein IKY34_05700 [Ruminiclostridium sp.]|nr:hypothetical protein [Ruminiclostridium sp.]
MRDPFDHPLEPMTSQQAQVAQKEREAQDSWKKTCMILLYVALGVYLLLMYCLPMLNAEKKALGGDEGILQDGVYYVYGGGGFPLPDEVKTPIGLCSYIPGQEPEVLVSSKDYSLDVVFPSWDANSHGLYFVDMNTETLYRMDLKTKEITELYALPEAPKGTNPYIFPNGLWEDRIALICHDGVDTYHLVLDCRTGEVLSREEDNDPGTRWNLVARDRILVKNLTDDHTDLLENGVSVLPQGHKLAEEETRAIGDAILVTSYPAEDMGDWSSRLFLADGRILDLPKDTEDTYYRFLTVSDQWLFYTSHEKDPTPNVTKFYTKLRAMDLNTMESYLVSTEYDPYFAVTDGNWFYSYGDYTNCYQLEYNDQGIPCGLTLIEERI